MLNFVMLDRVIYNRKSPVSSQVGNGAKFSHKNGELAATGKNASF